MPLNSLPLTSFFALRTRQTESVLVLVLCSTEGDDIGPEGTVQLLRCRGAPRHDQGVGAHGANPNVAGCTRGRCMGEGRGFN